MSGVADIMNLCMQIRTLKNVNAINKYLSIIRDMNVCLYTYLDVSNNGNAIM